MPAGLLLQRWLAGAVFVMARGIFVGCVAAAAAVAAWPSAALPARSGSSRSAGALAAFNAAQHRTRVIGPQVVPHAGPRSADDCAAACLGLGAGCIAFNWLAAATHRHRGDPVPRAPPAACELSGWGPELMLWRNQSSAHAYYSKVLPRNDTAAEHTVQYVLDVPTGGVALTGGPFETAFATNLAYLSQFPVDDVLYWFRQRAGQPQPAGAASWGWDGHEEPLGSGRVVASTPAVPGGRNVDGPYGLRGSVAGAFMMGSGGATRWVEDAELRSRLEQVVGNITHLQGADGFAMAFRRNETNSHENPDYVQSWVTHGLLEAHAGGVDGALATLRKHFDWFNYATDVLATLLPPYSAVPGEEPTSPPCSGDMRAFGHCVYLIYQGMIHNTRVATSPVGTKRDVQVVQDLYQEDWWLRMLAARNTSAVWRRQSAHNYEITALEAYLDMYMLTGEARYIEAMDGAWDLFRDFWIHVGGSIAINEGALYPPGSYFLASHATGELCGSSFWIRFNQRYHRLRPNAEVYTAEIERSLINVILANQAAPSADPPGIRYFAVLEGAKANPTSFVTCCESQGTRTYGALPEFVYSTTSASALAAGAEAAVWVNLLVPSVYHGDGFRIVQATGFPSNGSVSLALHRDARAPGGGGGGGGGHEGEGDGGGGDGRGRAKARVRTVMLRIPSWMAEPTVPVTVTDSATGSVVAALTGARGSYLAVTLGDAEVVEARFPMGLRVSMYNGTTPTPSGGCGSVGVARAAVEWGPVLLAATYNTSNPKCTQSRSPSGGGDEDADGARSRLPPRSGTAVSIAGVDPRSPVEDWLIPAGHDGLEPLFSVKGTGGCVVFRPYYALQAQAMSVYPNFLPKGASKPGQCGVAKENWPAETSAVCLACPAGKTVSKVVDAQFGVASGNCSAGYQFPSCRANASVVKAVVEGRCLGTQVCTVPVDHALFGADPCVGQYKSLAAEVACAVPQCDVVSENWPKESTAVVVGCAGGRAISAVLDAAFGVVVGNCSAGFSMPRCHADPVVVRSVVAARCVGKANCTVPADDRLYGKDPCAGTVKQLAVRVRC